MHKIKVSSKGAVTIPKAMRQSLGIMPGVALQAEEREGAIVLKTASKSLSPKRLPTRDEVEQLSRMLPYHGPTYTLEEIDQKLEAFFRTEWKP
jgi:AbrB family looped-hinge helix DNA binding protein